MSLLSSALGECQGAEVRLIGMKLLRALQGPGPQPRLRLPLPSSSTGTLPTEMGNYLFAFCKQTV